MLTETPIRLYSPWLLPSSQILDNILFMTTGYSLSHRTLSATVEKILDRSLKKMEQSERAKERETSGKSKATYVSEYGLISASVMRDVCVWQEIPTRVVDLLERQFDYIPPNVEDEDDEDDDDPKHMMSSVKQGMASLLAHLGLGPPVDAASLPAPGADSGAGALSRRAAPSSPSLVPYHNSPYRAQRSDEIQAAVNNAVGEAMRQFAEQNGLIMGDFGPRGPSRQELEHGAVKIFRMLDINLESAISKDVFFDALFDENVREILHLPAELSRSNTLKIGMLFDKIDTNDDGLVSEAEFKRFWADAMQGKIKEITSTSAGGSPTRALKGPTKRDSYELWS